MHLNWIEMFDIHVENEVVHVDGSWETFSDVIFAYVYSSKSHIINYGTKKLAIWTTEIWGKHSSPYQFKRWVNDGDIAIAYRNIMQLRHDNSSTHCNRFHLFWIMQSFWTGNINGKLYIDVTEVRKLNINT